MSDDGFQRYLFEYHYDNAEWGFEIMARSAGEAKERVKQLARAKYQGEVKLKLSVPAGGFLPRWFHRIRAALAKDAGQ
jgi:hypothetical protein